MTFLAARHAGALNMVNRLHGKSLTALLAPGAFAPIAQAADAPVLNTGSTAWMITAAVLVLFMCLPGLALFYGGLVRAKNMLSLFTQCFGIAGVVGVLWVIYGYSMVVDTSNMVEGQVSFNSFVGGLSRAFLAGMTPDSLVGDIPEGVFVTFQMTFAIITPALIAGAFAARMKFSAALLFMALWFTLVYAPVAHMVWGGAGALMHNWGVLDFAGGTAVHINAGVAALAACLVLGKRKGYQNTPMPAHNLSLTMAGAAMLWVGW
ncbi:Ammonium transporter, partial [Pseudomonas savastanoi pv. phaseolicola]